jgi:hypothetical protein
LKLAPSPARSVAAAIFTFYLADPISSMHEFTPIRAVAAAALCIFVAIRVIPVEQKEARRYITSIGHGHRGPVTLVQLLHPTLFGTSYNAAW